MPKFASFVLEHSNNPGTGPFALSGAPPGRRGWSGAFADGDVYYFADDGTQAEWGIGRLTHGQPATISRDKVLGNTFDRQDRLNFTGLVYVYSDQPAEAVPPPVTQGISVIPDINYFDQSQTLPAMDVVASGTTLRVDFSATLQVHPASGGATAWQAVRIAVNVWTVDAQGNNPAQPFAAAGANARILQPHGTTVTVRSVALGVTPGSLLRVGATVGYLTSSSSGTASLPMKMGDAAITWISI